MDRENLSPNDCPKMIPVSTTFDGSVVMIDAGPSLR